MTTTETPMRERIARAILDGNARGDHSQTITDAVLDAMQEPTSGMIEAAYKAPMLGGFKSQYQCAIDAAKEGK